MTRNKITAGILSALISCGTASAAVSIVSDGDTYIRNSSSDTNYGADDYMVSNLSGTDVRIALFSFDISAVPLGGITSAKLQLEDVVGNATKSYNVYGLKDVAENFDETTLTWENAGFIDGSTIDLSKVYGGAALGDFDNTKNSINTVFDVTSGNYLDFLNGSADSDVTFVIVDTNSGNTGSGWATKEHATALKPTLTVTAVPEPSSLALLALGGLALVSRHRKN